jgi:hypothetical protein
VHGPFARANISTAERWNARMALFIGGNVHRLALLLLCIMAGGCASSRWEIARPASGDPKNAILLDRQTGETWINFGNDNNWTRMNRR